MQNPHGFFNVPPNSSTAGAFDPSSLPRQGNMTFPPNMIPGDNSYLTNTSLMERPYPSTMARGDGAHTPIINPIGGMMGPPRMAGIDHLHSASHNVWNPAGQRDMNTEVYRQFQLHRGPEGTPPGSQQQVQFPSSASGSSVAGIQFGDAASGQAPDMSMMLAQMMSVPLATAFVQGMMANTPPVLPGLQANPNQFPVMSPAPPNPMIQMMQQMFQVGQQPATGVSSSGTPPIQLPPMDTNVAKTLLFQLAQQLQQAGQLPNDDTFQSFLRTVQSPGATMVTSTCGTNPVKTEVKKEPVESTFALERSPDITSDGSNKHITKSEPLVNLKTEDGATQNHSKNSKSSKSDISGVSSSNVYIDVAETALPANHSEDECSDFDVGNDFDRSDDLDDEPLSYVLGLKSSLHKVPKGTNLSSQRYDKAQSMRPASRKYSGKSIALTEEPKRKSHSTAHCVSAEEGFLGSRVSRIDNASSSMLGTGHRKTSFKEVRKGVRWDRNLRLKDCFVKLVRVQIKRDSKGAIVLPKKELSRVARLKQHKVSINVWLNNNDAGLAESEMPKLEPETDLVQRHVSLQTSRFVAPVASCSVETPSIPVPKSVTIEATSRLVNKKASAVEAVSLQVPVLSNINSSRNPQLRSMYMGLPKDNMEWLSLIGCQRHNPSNRNTQKQFCQCAFCPAVGLMPREVALHIRSEHLELTFALAKIRVSTGLVLYICCRHCDFIAVEPAIIWIHFEIHHNVSGILDSSGNRHVNLSLSIDDPPLKPISLDDVLSTLTSFVCFDCGAVVTDRDIHAGSSRLARHVLRRHPHTQNYNGCFVKLLMLQYVEGEATLNGSSVTYRQAIYSEIYERSRREVYVCMLCRYSAFCPYLALSHNLMTHQSKHLMYNCSDCDYQCISDSDILIHNTTKHRNGSVSTTVTCSVTLVRQSESGIGYVEYSPIDNRKSVLTFVERPLSTTKLVSVSKPDLDEKSTVRKANHTEEEKEKSQPTKKAKVVKGKTEPTRRLGRRSKLDENPFEKEDAKNDADVEVQSTTVSSSGNEAPSVVLLNKTSASACDETMSMKDGATNAANVLCAGKNVSPMKDVSRSVDECFPMNTDCERNEKEDSSSVSKMQEERFNKKNCGIELAEYLPAAASFSEQVGAVSNGQSSTATDQEPQATVTVENGTDEVHAGAENVETSDTTNKINEHCAPNEKNTTTVFVQASSLIGDARHSEVQTTYSEMSYVPYVSLKKVNNDNSMVSSIEISSDTEHTAMSLELAVAAGPPDESHMQSHVSETASIEKTGQVILTSDPGSAFDALDRSTNAGEPTEQAAKEQSLDHSC